MTTCPDCGSQNPENVTFCMHCGTQVQEGLEHPADVEGMVTPEAATHDALDLNDADQTDEPMEPTNTEAVQDEADEPSAATEIDLEEEGTNNQPESDATYESLVEEDPQQDQTNTQSEDGAIGTELEDELSANENPTIDPETPDKCADTPSITEQAESDQSETEPETESGSETASESETESESESSVQNAHDDEVENDPASEIEKDAVSDQASTNVDVPPIGSPLDGLPLPHSSPLSPLQLDDGGQAERGVRWWLSPDADEVEPETEVASSPEPGTRIPSKPAVEINRQDDDDRVLEESASDRSNGPIVAAVIVVLLVITAFMVL